MVSGQDDSLHTARGSVKSDMRCVSYQGQWHRRPYTGLAVAPDRGFKAY